MSKTVYDTLTNPPATIIVPDDWVVRRPFTLVEPPTALDIVGFDWIGNKWITSVPEATVDSLSGALAELANEVYNVIENPSTPEEGGETDG